MSVFICSWPLSPSMQDISIEELKRFIEDYAEKCDQRVGDLQEEIGLFLHEPLSRCDYFCTPLNSVTFASTGGDGVHYGFLDVTNSSVKPVIMTVPMANIKNMIVGESLHEFLRLGSRYGYFSLEKLAYNQERTIAEINASFLRTESETASMLLVHLTKEFGLTAWDNIGDRLTELERIYSSHLILPDAQRQG